MNNGLMYNLLGTILRKEKEGQTISPEQYSELLQMCSLEKANTDYARFEQDQIVTDSLRSLKTSSDITVTGGVGTMPSDYWHTTNVSHSTTDYPIIPIDIVTDVEYQALSFSDLEQPQELWPILKIEGDEFTVNPDSITAVKFDFLKNPNTPFFDYYIDADDNIQYLEVGETYTLQAGEEYRDGTTTGDVTSISVELSFPEGERAQVLYMILEKLAVSLKEQDALQYGLMREQKEQSE